MTIKEMRETLTAEDVKDVLDRLFDEQPRRETSNYLIFRTCCHNLEGGSDKLYYYNNTGLFKCFTECDGYFDVFELIKKMYALRGKEISLVDALRKCGFNDGNFNLAEVDSLDTAINYAAKLAKDPEPEEETELVALKESVLRMYSDDKQPLSSWVNEGIDVRTMIKYNIKFDSFNNAIAIPHYDSNGKIVGIRGRFLSPEAPAKYKPLSQMGKMLNHPVSKTLYGFYQNKEAIAEKGVAVIFEGEKSVLKFDTIYNRQSTAVAVCGQNISNTHIDMLLSLGVHTVIIAFDRDYETYEEALEKEKTYINIGKKLINYFNVSIIMDFDFLTNHKDSPIDQGETIFNQLMRERKQI